MTKAEQGEDFLFLYFRQPHDLSLHGYHATTHSRHCV